MRRFTISSKPATQSDIEVVERKGIGHPDTICDALAEALSLALCREYLARFGEIAHHNVDKALLCAGMSAPQFGGGGVLAPIDIYLAGRAIAQVGAERIPLEDIAIDTSRAWLATHLHALDADAHVRIHPVLRAGSGELKNLFQRRGGAAPLANDTSFGVGYAPLSALEQCVLAIERSLNEEPRPADRLAWGEDVKVMGVRVGADVEITIACAMVDAHIETLVRYLEEKERIAALAIREAEGHGFGDCRISVNAADHIETGDVYLTVTGTSAEAGDDGQVGRGNRVNGLITPARPMSLEAAAGKNPVTHVGKLYNVAANAIAHEIVEAISPVRRAQCLLVGRIGAPITEPAFVELKLETEPGVSNDDVAPAAQTIAANVVANLPKQVSAFIAGDLSVY
ncbi:MAG TPA: methionine adenosyltransferase [Caulobacterales bacterium]|nr:methionine adenosyltransferase [Caulobacterales bacterium]